MTDDEVAVALYEASQEVSALRCPEFTRTDRGWERCHRDEHNPDARHHVRDRSWSTAELRDLSPGVMCCNCCKLRPNSTDDQYRKYE